ncbi:hypothetical protein [Staphylococcus shinii]|uniref:hypothetical protein n=1 Tax=Staphylococcus shinii TaxID=2912228 RepID=UPI003CF08688
MEEIKFEITNTIENNILKTIKELKDTLENLHRGIEDLDINKTSYLLSNLINYKKAYDIELIRYSNKNQITEENVNNDIENFISDMHKFVKDPSVFKNDYSWLISLVSDITKEKLHEYTFINIA